MQSDFKFNLAVFLVCMVVAGPLLASGYFSDELKDLQTTPRLDKIPNPYRQPVSINPSLKDQGMTCEQLQREINEVTRLTYSYKPRPYDDPIVGASALAGSFVLFPLQFGLGWTGIAGYQEEKRIAEAQDLIDMLRQLKAERHCFECRGGNACP